MQKYQIHSKEYHYVDLNPRQWVRACLLLGGLSEGMGIWNFQKIVGYRRRPYTDSKSFHGPMIAILSRHPFLCDQNRMNYSGASPLVLGPSTDR